MKGAVIFVAGPDGSGKSTLCSRLERALAGYSVKRIHHRPSVLPRRTRGAVTDPHASVPYGRAGSLLKYAYLMVDYHLGWIRHVRPHVRDGGIVLIERGWADLIIDPRRYRLHLSMSTLRKLARLLPLPDLTLILEADAEVVLARKRELSAAELRAQASRWRQLKSIGPTKFLDASRSAGEVLTEAMREIDVLMHKDSSGSPTEPARGFTVLPNRRTPRWLIPRANTKAARNAFLLYQPVTLKGRIGWRAGRIAAGMGGFRLLPSGRFQFPDVEPTLRRFIPDGGTFALGKALHPGRYVALVLGADGEPTLFAKLATDEAGRLALKQEALALRRVARWLPHGIVAPEVLGEEDGFLMLQPIAWVPRRHPSKLPLRAAQLIGNFYRRGANDASLSGPAHGDFAPWNLLRTPEGWGLVDWESASEGRPPFFDPFHYLVQAHALLGEPVSTITEAILGRGPSGSALVAYAEAAGVPFASAGQHLDVYLRTSMQACNPRQPEGTKAIQIRRHLLASLR